MKKSNEIEIIKIFQRYFGRKRFFPEDLEVLRMARTNFIIKSDMLVQSTDVPPGMNLLATARKSLVACVSDFSCKGIRPKYATISLAIPRGFTRKQINELAKGFAHASKEFGIDIVGGDVNEGKEIIIEVSMFGVGNKIVRRRGARIGDIIITSGPFGYCSAGLRIIFDHLRANSWFRNKCREGVFFPVPRLEFGLKAAKYLSSSMDSSDGLSMTLNEMCEQSKKKFVITNIPTEEEVIKFAKENSINLANLVFCGGEEYEIVATIPRRNLEKIRKLAKKLRVPLFEIGFVTRGRGVVLTKDKTTTIKRCGWIHLQS